MNFIVYNILELYKFQMKVESLFMKQLIKLKETMKFGDDECNRLPLEPQYRI